jgi:hypothetical protein
MIKILVLGDSHVRVFKYCNEQQKNIYFEVIAVGGATAQGSVNPNSNTNALNLFKEKLKNIQNKDFKYIVINLGEVDCGHLIWYRKDKYNISIEEQLKITTDNLFKFINLEILPKFNSSKVIVNGSILPTIKDNTDKNYLKGTRSEINTSQIDRTNLTLKYNEILKNNCLKNGYNYMDITEHILNNNTKVINDIYLNKDKYDHHLDDSLTYNLWLKELNKIISI